jgi:hypothetical protein
LIYTDSLATCIAVLRKHAVEAGQTVRSAFSHYIALTSQVSITFKAGKVLHMPGPSFCLGTLVRENNLREKMIKVNCQVIKVSDMTILWVDVLPFTQTNTFYHIPIAFESVA